MKGARSARKRSRKQSPVRDALRTRRNDNGVNGAAERNDLKDLDHQRSSDPSNERITAL